MTATAACLSPAAGFTARLDLHSIASSTRSCHVQVRQHVPIQSGPEDEEADAIATQAGVPKHMNLGLVQMKDQECMDRCPAAISISALL